jgi:hypothetical protein
MAFLKSFQANSGTYLLTYSMEQSSS